MLEVMLNRDQIFTLRDKRLFEITDVEITRVDCNFLPMRQSFFCFSGGAGKFFLAHRIRISAFYLTDNSFLTYETDDLF